MKQDVSLKLPNLTWPALYIWISYHTDQFLRPMCQMDNIEVRLVSICSQCNQCENGPADPLRQPINREQTNIRSWQQHHMLPIFLAHLLTGYYPIFQQIRFGSTWTEDNNKIPCWIGPICCQIKSLKIVSNVIVQISSGAFEVEHWTSKHMILMVLVTYWCGRGYVADHLIIFEANHRLWVLSTRR